MNKRILRSFSEHKGRYIAITMLLLFGSFLLVVMGSLGSNMGGMLEKYESESLQEDVLFTTAELLTDIPALEAVTGASIEGVKNFDTTLSDGTQLRLLSAGERVNLPVVREGAGLQNPNDLLLDPYYMTNQGLSIGDELVVEGKTFRVAGSVAIPNYVYVLKNVYDLMPPVGFGLGLVSDEVFDSLPEAQTVYAARFDSREGINAQLVSLRAALQQEGYDITEWVDAMNNKRIRMPWASINGMKTMSIPLPTAMFLLSCLVVGILIWRTIKADGVVIGALYAQGFRRRELTRHYMTLPLLLAGAGGALGAILGIPCVAPVVDLMFSSYYNVPHEAATVPLGIILAGVLLPILFVGLSSWLVMRSQLKKSAAELMKGNKDLGKVNVLERHLRLGSLKFATRFKLRAQLRSIPRLLFLLLGVLAASMMMLVGFTLQYSFDAVLGGDGTDDMYNFTYEYSFKALQEGEVPEGAIPFNAMRAYPEDNEIAEFYITGLPVGSGVVKLKDSQGNALPDNQVNITAPLANRLKLAAGDSISFVNKLDGEIHTLTIDAVAQSDSGSFIFMPLDEFNLMAMLPEGAYSGLFSETTLSVDESLLSGFKDMDNMDSMEDLAMPMLFMVAGITAFAALMGGIIIYLVTSLMIEESRGTVSLMKVFGYRHSEIGPLVLNGATPFVVFGFALATPLTVMSLDAIYSYLGEMINITLPIMVSPLYVLISFALVLAVYLLTRRLSARKIAQLSMNVALKAGAE